LEYYNGYVLSNVWYTNVILRIDPETGNVERIHRFDNIYKERHEKADCFNGIALSEKTGELFVTGKWWPHLYRIKLFD
jgi:glutamine cyclotransferase